MRVGRVIAETVMNRSQILRLAASSRPRPHLHPSTLGDRIIERDTVIAAFDVESGCRLLGEFIGWSVTSVCSEAKN